MDKLMNFSWKNRLPLYKLCMKGICNDILQVIESKIKGIDSFNKKNL